MISQRAASRARSWDDETPLLNSHRGRRRHSATGPFRSTPATTAGELSVGVGLGGRPSGSGSVLLHSSSRAAWHPGSDPRLLLFFNQRPLACDGGLGRRGAHSGTPASRAPSGSASRRRPRAGRRAAGPASAPRGRIPRRRWLDRDDTRIQERCREGRHSRHHAAANSSGSDRLRTSRARSSCVKTASRSILSQGVLTSTSQIFSTSPSLAHRARTSLGVGPGGLRYKSSSAVLAMSSTPSSGSGRREPAESRHLKWWAVSPPIQLIRSRDCRLDPVMPATSGASDRGSSTYRSARHAVNPAAPGGTNRVDPAGRIARLQFLAAPATKSMSRVK